MRSVSATPLPKRQGTGAVQELAQLGDAPWLPFVIRYSSFVIALLLLLSHPPTLHAQPAPPPNRVLDLDGRGDWARLPPAGFTNFHQATIEAWVKFRTFSGFERVFDFGARQRELYVGISLGSATLNSAGAKFLVVDAAGSRRREDVYGGFRLNEWTYVAVVTGSGGVRMYLEEFEVLKLVQEVAATVQPLITKNANALQVHCPADIGVMKAGVTKVRQTLFNLLSNASKFTERGVIKLEIQKRIRQKCSVTSADARGGAPGVPVAADRLGAAFPLIPALSPGEREEGSAPPVENDRVRSSRGSGLDETRTTSLPLPGGESRGEGGRSSLNPQPSTLNFVVSDSGTV